MKLRKSPLLILNTLLLVACASTSSSSFSNVTSKSNSTSTSIRESSAVSNSESKSSNSSKGETSKSISSTSESGEPGEYKYHKGLNDQTNTNIKDSKEFTEFWDYSSDIKISLNMKEDAFKTMCETQGSSMPKLADAYFPGDLTIVMNDETYTFEEVGVRLKGNTSRRSMLDGNGDISKAAHMKISLKQTFDGEIYDKDEKITKFKKTWDDTAARKARKDRNLFGMEKFDLKYVSRNSFGGGFGGGSFDNGAFCYARELYAYDMFRREGMLAPHSNMVSVTLNNEVSEKTFKYQSIECVDSVFLKRHFSKADAKGDLYKCTVQNFDGKSNIANFSRSNSIEEVDGELRRVVGGRIGVEDPYERYFPSYQLKTNDNGDDSDFSNMVNLIQALYLCNEEGASNEVLESVVDMDEFLNFSAVSYLLGNFDDLRYNTNNAYVYFVPSTGKIVPIAYDYDYCLGIGNDMSSRAPFDTYTMSGNISRLYRATILNEDGITHSYSKEGYQNSFLNYCKNALNDGVLSEETVDDLTGKLHIPYKNDEENNSIKTYMGKKVNKVNQYL